MPHSPAPHVLLPRQSRLINASEGLTLEVTSGCLWLTRPGDSVDRFIVAGASIELHENLVLIQPDALGGTGRPNPVHYHLKPLKEPVPIVAFDMGELLCRGGRFFRAWVLQWGFLPNRLTYRTRQDP
jgi:hypothetical protein